MSWNITATTQPHQARQAHAPAPFATDHDDQVLTFLEWCQLNRITERNGRRILASDHGPAVVQLSAEADRGHRPCPIGHGSKRDRAGGRRDDAAFAKTVVVVVGHPRSDKLCCRHVLDRGRSGFEAFDVDDQSLGRFDTLYHFYIRVS